MKKYTLAAAAFATAASFNAFAGEHSNSSAAHKKNFFVKAGVGASFAEKLNGQSFKITAKSPKTAMNFGLSGGYMFNEKFSLGLGVNYLHDAKTKKLEMTSTQATTTVDSTKISSLAFDVIGAYNIMEYKHFTPYVSVSLGVANNEMDQFSVSELVSLAGSSSNGQTFHSGLGTTLTNSYKGSRTAFSWGVRLGVGYSINDDWCVDLSGGFKDRGKLQAKRVEDTASTVHAGDDNFTAKLRSYNVMLSVGYKI